MATHPDPTKTLIRGVILTPYLVGVVVYTPALLAAVLAAAIVAVFLLPYAPSLRARFSRGQHGPLRHRRV
jgi:hypothetical protein